MADIIGSRKQDQSSLSDDFKKVTSLVNNNYYKKMLSPLTVTLGDEFQSVPLDLKSAIEIILLLEEEIFDIPTDFKLRYVLSRGEISSEINTKIGWGMMGDGLTYSREKLNSIKKTRKRFYIDSSITNSTLLNNAFFIYGSIIDDWDHNRDLPVISAYNKTERRDYKEVANILKKNPDQIWKREKTLKIMEYYAIKEIILGLCEVQ
jgi:hypothetical protein